MNRAETARANGALSHGPVTPEGKTRASRNALTHGLNSKDVVIACESREEFDSMLAEYIRQHRPADDIERSLVFEMAAARWRMYRVIALETAAFDEEINRVMNDEENPIEDPGRATAIAFDHLANGRALANIHRYESRLRRHCEKALQELLDRQAFRARNPVRNQPLIAPEIPDDPEVLRKVCENILRETNPTAEARDGLNACLALLKTQNEPERARTAASATP